MCDLVIEKVAHAPQTTVATENLSRGRILGPCIDQINLKMLYGFVSFKEYELDGWFFLTFRNIRVGEEKLHFRIQQCFSEGLAAHKFGYYLSHQV